MLNRLMGDHHHTSRREFFHRSFGGILAGASVFEEAFLRAGWARAQAPTATANLFDIEKVAEGVFAALAKPAALTNCNAAIFVLSRDVLVVDAHSKPSAAAALIAQIKKEVTDKPVRYLVNTHFHWDHTQGDAAYKKANPQVRIIASDATKQILSQSQRDRLKESLDSVPSLIEAAKSRLSRAKTEQERDWANEQIRQLTAYEAEMKSYPLELPTFTFAKNHIIKDASGDLELAFHGKAHTAGDIQVFSPARKAVASGDAIIGFLPNINDGYPRPWPATIDSVAAWKFDQIIAGHGPVQHGRDRMGQFRNYIEDLSGRVERAKKAGTPLAELQKSITPASLPTMQTGGFGTYVADNLDKYTVYLGNRTPVEERLAANIAAIYNNLDKV
ncbi:MAG: MBL fold metallo-hydrolase [Acidobacteriia bacterium]|nr:MBL fold metallo-hydrolase [Terriglobia bacterium]MBV8905284.1 MBL fold metallo-hydrolase [Terriglobia bacterium]